MIIAKTETGQQVLKDRSMNLTPRQRAALIMVDGKKTLAQLQAATAATREDVDYLLGLGLVCDVDPSATAAEAARAEAGRAAVQRHKARSPQERYAEAYPLATRLTAGLGLRGFRLNLAVEAATSYEDLANLAPRILEAVGPEKFTPLDEALNDR